MRKNILLLCGACVVAVGMLFGILGFRYFSKSADSQPISAKTMALCVEDMKKASDTQAKNLNALVGTLVQEEKTSKQQLAALDHKISTTIVEFNAKISALESRLEKEQKKAIKKNTDKQLALFDRRLTSTLSLIHI